MQEEIRVIGYTPEGMPMLEFSKEYLEELERINKMTHNLSPEVR